MPCAPTSIVSNLRWVVAFAALASCVPDTGNPNHGGQGGSGGSSATIDVSVGGNVSGLLGQGLVLSLNGMDDLFVAASGPFAFSSRLPSGTPYAVAVKSQPKSPSQTCLVSMGSGTTTGADVANVQVTCATDAFKVGGTVSSLAGTGLVLQNSGKDDLAVASAGPFVFANPVLSGEAYAVTVKSQPTSPSQVCTVAAGTGTVGSGAVSSVSVSCANTAFPVGGTVSGLVGTGLVLQNNAGDDLSVTGNNPFAFATPVASGAPYSVTVKAQPSSPQQTCSVTQAAGTVAASPVTNVSVTCVTSTFPVSVQVSGLLGVGLVASNNGENLALPSNGTSTFPTQVESGAGYAVTIATQPSTLHQTCTASNATGVITDAGATVGLSCATRAFKVGGAVTGLRDGGSVTLVNQVSTAVPVTFAGTDASVPFQFSTPVLSGAPYSVDVQVQPTVPSQTCTVDGGRGTMDGGDITSVHVACATNAFPVTAVVYGFADAGTLVLRNNGGDDLNVTGSGPATFPTHVPSGNPYLVSVSTQPSGYFCSVSAPSGTVGAGPVTSVTVNCSRLYTLGGSVASLSGVGLVLQTDAGDQVSITANTPYAFPTPVPNGSTYAAFVKTQPTSPWQTCTVANPEGTVVGQNVENLNVGCTTNTYNVGGTVWGLSTGALTLRNADAGDVSLTSFTLGAGGSFKFPNPAPSLASYKVTVAANPTTPGLGKTCTVDGGTGTVQGSNITSVFVTCVDNYRVGGSISLLYGASLRLRLNGQPSSDVVVSYPATSYQFTTPVAQGSPYVVTIAGQPTAYVQTCSLTNPSGTMPGANVTNANVTCDGVTQVQLTSTAFTVNSVVQGSPATIPDGTSLSCDPPAPGQTLVGSIVIPDAHFAVRTVRVTLTGLTHSYFGDLTATLVKTPSTFASLFARVGRPSTHACGTAARASGAYPFYDSATNAMWAPAIVNGTTSYTVPAVPYRATGASGTNVDLNTIFNGASTYGTWQLWLTDSTQGDIGTIASWTLHLLYN